MLLWEAPARQRCARFSSLSPSGTHDACARLAFLCSCPLSPVCVYLKTGIAALTACRSPAPTFQLLVMAAAQKHAQATE